MSPVVPSRVIPAAVAVLAAALITHWLLATPHTVKMDRRVPAPLTARNAAAQAPQIDIKGTFATGPGKPGELPPAPTAPASWPCFRNAAHDNISTESVRLRRDWATPPARLWQIDAGEGYAGPSVVNGRVYFLDYDQEGKADVLRCLSTTDGQEIWQRGYKIDIGRNHGISRTVCAVGDGVVVSLGPKCQVMCVDAKTGDFKWGIDLVREYKTEVPPWYAGQNPLLDDGKAILAPAGAALLIAVDLQTGKVIWQTPNPRKWGMTHSSVMPVMFQGKKLYLYCANEGLVGVWASDGTLAFQFKDWVVPMANVPTPLPLPDDRVLLTGGYGAGSMMIKLEASAGGIQPRTLFRLPPEVFGAEQQSPIFYKGFIYGVIPVRSELVCVDLDGKVRWSSGPKNKVGLGPFLIADGCILALNETGRLMLVEATPDAFHLLASASVLDHAHDAWGPMALVNGKLYCRDMTRLACIDLAETRN